LILPENRAKSFKFMEKQRRLKNWLSAIKQALLRKGLPRRAYALLAMTEYL
jgi:hypothetical protein